MLLLDLDFCLDLLSKECYEKIVYSILQKPRGTWRTLHSVMGLRDYRYSKSEIYVSWSDDPLSNKNDGFSLILFCEKDSMEIISASYNVRRLEANMKK